MADDVHAAVAARLQDAEQRYTPVRRALVDVLAGAARPLTIPEVLAERPGIAQSSAYRNLAVLEQAGAVRRVLGPDEFARFELAEELTEHHHHLVCTSCGSVEDFPPSRQLERTVAKAIDEVAAGTGFAPTGHRLDLVGLCRSCR